MNVHIIMAALGLTLAATAQAQDHYNRGIGIYPGSKAEHTAPQLVTDNDFRDLSKPLTAEMQIMDTKGNVIATNTVETQPDPDTTVAIFTDIVAPDLDVWFSDADSRGTKPDIVCQPFTLGE